MFRANPRNTGYNPDASGPDGELTVKWRKDEGFNPVGNPVVAGGSVYVGETIRDANLTALRATDGSVQWRTNTGMFTLDTPAIQSGLVYISGEAAYTGNRVKAFDETTGKKIWGTRVGPRQVDVGPPILSGDSVYVEPSSSRVKKLDSRTGEKLWAEGSGGFFPNAVAVVDDTVYVTSNNGIYSLSASDGSLKWPQDPLARDRRHPDTSPVVANGLIYLVGGETPSSGVGPLRAINRTSGERVWDAPISTGAYTGLADRTVPTAPAVANGVLYTGSRSGTVYALNATTGEELWNTSVSSPIDSSNYQYPGLLSPSVANGTVYIPDNPEGKLYALNASTGTVQQEIEVGRNIASSPVIVDNTIYLTLWSKDNFTDPEPGQVVAITGTENKRGVADLRVTVTSPREDGTTPIENASAYVYPATQETYEALSESVGQSTLAEVPDGALATKTTDNAGNVSFSSVDADNTCLLVVPPENSEFGAQYRCFELRAGEDRQVTIPLGPDRYLGFLADDMNGVHQASNESIRRSLAAAADVYTNRDDQFQDDPTFTDKDALTALQIVFKEALTSLGREPVPRIGLSLLNEINEQAIKGLYEQQLNEERARQVAQLRTDQAVYATRVSTTGTRNDAAFIAQAAGDLNQSAWYRNSRYVDNSTRAVTQGYNNLTIITVARQDIGRNHTRFERSRTGSPPGLDPANRRALERLVADQERSLAGESIITSFVATPRGDIYTTDSALAHRSAYYGAIREAYRAQNAQDTVWMVSSSGTILIVVSGPISTAIAALTQVADWYYYAKEQAANNNAANQFVNTQVYALRDARHVAEVNDHLVTYLSDAETVRSAGEARVEVQQYDSGLSENKLELANGPPNACVKTTYRSNATITYRNTGDSPANARVIVLTGEAVNGRLGSTESAGVAPREREEIELMPGETTEVNVTYTGTDDPLDPFEPHQLHTVLTVNGRRTHLESHTFYTETQRPGWDACSPSLDSESTTDASGLAAGTTSDTPMASAQNPADLRSTSETVIDTEMGPGRDSETATITTDPGTQRLTVTMATLPAVDVDLRVANAAGRVSGVDPTTNRDVGSIPNSTYTGSEAAIERITIDNASNRTLSISTVANAYRSDQPVPVQVSVRETPERPAMLGVAPQITFVEARPNETVNATLRVGEVGDQRRLSDVTTSVSPLRNGAGNQLNARVSGPSADVIGAGNESTAFLHVDVPSSLTDRLDNGTPTRFSGRVHLTASTAENTTAIASILVADTSIPNASIVDASPNVTGVHLHRTTAPTTPSRLDEQRRIAAYDLDTQGNGPLELNLPVDETNTTEYRVYTVSQATWREVNATTVGRSVIVETNARNQTLVVMSNRTRPIDAGLNVTLLTSTNNVGSPIKIGVNASSPTTSIDSLTFVQSDGTTVPITESCANDSSKSCLTFVPNESTWNGTEYHDAEVIVRATNATGATSTARVSTPVYIAGDATGDGRVDIFDAVAVGRAWQTSRGEPGYSDAEDLNNDGQVNIFDAVIVGRKWQATAS
jgi:outer membrane protein assembly factor BamB